MHRIELMRIVIFFSAVSCEHPKAVQILLSHGADKSLKDSDGLSPSELETSEEIRTLLGRT